MSNVSNFAASPALIAAEGDGVSVSVRSVAGGYVFEVVGGFANAGEFASGDGSPFATAEAALAAANDPDCDDVSEFVGD